DIPTRRNADSFGSRESRLLGQTPVASESFLPGVGDVMDRADRQVELINRVSFTQRQPHIFGLVKVDGSGTVQSRIRKPRPIRRWQPFAGLGERRDRSRVQVHFANAIVADVTDVQ